MNDFNEVIKFAESIALKAFQSEINNEKYANINVNSLNVL